MWSPWKHQKTFGFLMFLRVSKGSFWTKWVNTFRLTWNLKEFDLVFNPFRPEALLWSPWKHQKTFGFQMFSGGSKGNFRRKWVNAFRLTWDFSQVHWEGVSAHFSRISKFCWTFYWTFKFARRNLLQKRRFYWNFPEIFSVFSKKTSKIKNFMIRQLYERHLPFSKFS